MKNIHLIPTDKPSRLGKFIDTNNLFLRKSNDIPRGENINIYITSGEETLSNNGDYYLRYPKYNTINKWNMVGIHEGKQAWIKKIILTTDQDLIKDGVQSIPDEFLEWFVKNPSCEEVEIESWQTKGEWDLDYKIIIPKEEPKQETTLEEAAERYVKSDLKKTPLYGMFNDTFKEGAKWQQERSYSEDDLKEAFKSGRMVKNYKGEWEETYSDEMTSCKYEDFNKWFEQFKKK